MTYCDFKPGDEVVHHRPIDYGTVVADSLVLGQTYTVRAVVPIIHMDMSCDYSRLLIELEEADWGGKLPGVRGAYRPQYFRKVQRRDLNAWLETATDFEEPRRKKQDA